MYFAVINLKSALDKSFYPKIKKSFIVISITSNCIKKPYKIPDNENCLDVLYIKFDDINYSDDRVGEYECPILEKDAKMILSFVFKYKNQVNDILIHCEAGMSRSPAVALALSTILNEDKPENFIQSLYGLKHANNLVYDTIIKTYKKYGTK